MNFKAIKTWSYTLEQILLDILKFYLLHVFKIFKYSFAFLFRKITFFGTVHRNIINAYNAKILKCFSQIIFPF